MRVRLPSPPGGAPKRISVGRKPHGSLREKALIMTARHWLVTSFIPDEAVIPEPTEENYVRYAIGQQEICPETNRRHIQAYIEFNRPVRLPHVQRVLGDTTAHCEPRRGSRNEARDYCRKPQSRVPSTTPTETGVWNECAAGARTDLNGIRDLIRAGASVLEIADAHFTPWVRYHRAFDRYRLELRSHDLRAVAIHVYWGPSQTGKSHKAYHENPGAYWKPQGDWWDGYTGQSTVIMDDFYGWIKYSMMLRVCDQYPLHMEFKCGTVPAKWTKIIITSNQHPTDWYPNVADKTPLLRRMTSITEFTQVYTED